MIENHTVIGDYYRDHVDDEPDTCNVCGDEEYDMIHTFLGALCSSCTQHCAVCGEWMLGEDGIQDSSGNIAHKDHEVIL